MRRILAFAIASAICSVSAVSQASAQAPALVGKWNAEWELGRMVENGEVTAIRANGVISVEASGDSLLATIQVTKRSDNRPPAPNVVTLGGRMSARGATFVQKQTVRLNMNGEEQTREVTVTWTLNAEGDKLNGSMAREMPFVSEAPAPSEITGTRIP
ncbi:MAG: hypothetical protein IBJ03_05640 [Gemmatimonadaceae bacterium]|nr:hypothetical protein [Gemmatimonadaceae bacterium]